ncbi:28S ribosomal protein S34, mitochondrial [Zootermopsis nevadensis]|uniref:28S ribosomal protein S34, mitochondrial n=1 Tax=Zootermopsis nevadensis TaxID=136037 RepID=A0A067RKK9_ZOONE|nr:28S ribosomal protein S34, mitochondrial [Zootermopsis nevadensis]KDR20025.1 28S ribosomal protein S34, mitochondrial [Zootermopsis nevadensis]
MPIKYVGRTTSFKGKTLWEIVGNLKNFGVGRIVVRSTFERYPEPSYLKICKVQALANEDPRKVRILAEKVFRGRKYPKIVEVCSTSYKADYRLLPKDEEQAYCKTDSQVVLEKVRILPRTIPFPPLLREMILADRRAKGGDVTKEPEMEMIFGETRDSLSRKAREDEEPNVMFEPGIGTPRSPELYANIQRS